MLLCTALYLLAGPVCFGAYYALAKSEEKEVLQSLLEDMSMRSRIIGYLIWPYTIYFIRQNLVAELEVRAKPAAKETSVDELLRESMPQKSSRPKR